MTFLLKGKVTDEAGQLLPGARVRLFDGDDEVAGVTSSDNGGFNIAPVITGAGHDWRVEVKKEGFETLRRPIPPEGAADLTLVLRGGPTPSKITLSGVVVSSSGTQIPGARLQILDADSLIVGTQSDDKGHFEFSTSTPYNGDTWRIVVTKAGFVTLSERLRSGDDRGLRLTLQSTPDPKVTLSGVVVSSSGAQIPFARLQLLDGDSLVDNTKSDDKGHFEFSASTPFKGDTWRIVVTKEGFETLSEGLRSGVDHGLRLALREKATNGGNGTNRGRIIVVVAVVVVLAAIALWPRPPKQTVPTGLVGKSVEDVTNRLSGATLAWTINHKVASPPANPGTVWAVSPPEGGPLQKGQSLALDVDPGAVVPAILGLSLVQATNELDKADLYPDPVVPSNGHPKLEDNTVWSAYPTTGSVVKARSPIKVFVQRRGARPPISLTTSNEPAPSFSGIWYNRDWKGVGLESLNIRELAGKEPQIFIQFFPAVRRQGKVAVRSVRNSNNGEVLNVEWEDEIDKLQHDSVLTLVPSADPEIRMQDVYLDSHRVRVTDHLTLTHARPRVVN
jgi:Carboxypeptidase regulatory-like domain